MFGTLDICSAHVIGAFARLMFVTLDVCPAYVVAMVGTFDRGSCLGQRALAQLARLGRLLGSCSGHWTFAQHMSSPWLGRLIAAHAWDIERLIS
eukprot:3731231-Pyramimonas_sp.AAC.1